MADVDLATILADGDYLKRVGGALVGAVPASGGGVTDGDKGDIIVSSSGATWMLDTAVVTPAAKTVLDDTTTAAMLTTLGAASSTATTAALATKANLSRTINSYATNVTAIAGDAGAYVRLTGASATYTIPPNSSVAFAVGTQIDGIGVAGPMTLIAGAGVTLNKARTLVTLGAGSGWTIIKVATDTFDVHGDFV